MHLLNEQLYFFMNKYFDFSSKQLKFLIFLGVSALLLGSLQFIQNFATPSKNSPSFEIQLGNDQKIMTGIFKVDPNFAPADSLELLPGIGKVLADRIVAYRQHTRFKKMIDITDVRGIGPKLYEKIKPYLQVKPIE